MRRATSYTDRAAAEGDSQNTGEKVRVALDRTRQLEKELQQLKEQAAAQESAKPLQQSGRH